MAAGQSVPGPGTEEYLKCGLDIHTHGIECYREPRCNKQPHPKHKKSGRNSCYGVRPIGTVARRCG